MSMQKIAVIGLSTRYAGGANTPEQLWSNLKAGLDPIKDFPEGRWDRGYLNADPKMKARSYIYAGGYLDSVDTFDAEFFGISPREAQQIDPQQRLLLELAWEALENAGIVPERLAGSATGVFVGLSSRDYADYHDDRGIDAYTNLGLSLSIASNRISYVLDLKGPSMTIDTACSSGMVALHQAVQALRRGECSTALVGAANLVLSPKAFIGFSKASMLSPAGRCTPFDANGAGYVRAEGGGVLVLKPLEAAERDGDEILGVIVNTGVNSDGRTMGIALPSAEAQAALLERVYGEAGLKADDIYYVEAHGTGTAVGDPIECSAIARVLGGERRGGEPLRVGSIKSNVGHLEPAAGIAGLTKVLLSIKHREIPAILHFKTPNPKIDFDGWKLDVVHRHHPLPERDTPLLFGVNSFGFGGTNGHAIIEEYRPAGARRAGTAPEAPAAAVSSVPPGGAARAATPWTDALVLSAMSPSALKATAEHWEGLIGDLAGLPDAQAAQRWTELRANALHRRTHHPVRLAIHAGGPDEALAALRRFRAGEHSLDVVTGKAPATGRARVAWVYSGNGPQWWGMGRELMAADPTFANAVRGVDAIFKGLSGWSLIDELMRDERTSRMALTEVAQPTLFAVQVGITEVLRAAGLGPDAVVGHSVGEVAAAWASGALSLAQATLVIHQRSLAQSATAGMGKMAALGIPADEAREAIARVGGFLELAAVNSPGAVTVAGDPERLETLCRQLVEAGKFARVLTLDYPFHTRAMDVIRDGLLQGLAPLVTEPPASSAVPFVSTVEGRVLDGDAMGPEYWWRNVREPVAFQAGIDHLLGELEITGFIEVGPHPVLRDYVVQCARARSVAATALTTLRRPRDGQGDPEVGLMRQAVCAAYANGLGDPVRLSPPPTTRVPMPAYPWQRQRHWRGEHGLPDQKPPSQRDHPLLGWRTHAYDTAWTNVVDVALLPYLKDHVIQDSVVFPGAGYVETVLAAARQLFGDKPAQIEGMDFLKPFVLPAGAPPAIRSRFDPADGTFDIESRPDILVAEGTLHSRGRVTAAEPSHRPAGIDVAALWDGLPVEIPAADHYARCDRRGLHYGPAFQSIKALRLSSADAADRVAAAWIELAPEDGSCLPSYRSHPAIFDGCLQVVVTLMDALGEDRRSFIPIRVDRLRWFAPLPARVFCEVRLLRDSDRSATARFVIRDETGECLMSIDSARLQKVDFGTDRPPMRLADRWERDPLASPTAAIALPEPADVLGITGARAERPDDVLDALAGAYAAAALRDLQRLAGIDQGAGFTVAALQRRARVLPEQQPLLRALADMAVADGLLVAEGATLRWAADALPAADALWRQCALRHPDHTAELMLVAQAGERLTQLLRGEAEPARPAGGDRPNPAFETLLDNAPFRAAAGDRLARTLAVLASRWPDGRPVRVIELHAGSGSLVETVLAALPSSRTEYTVSDADPQAVERLAQRFGGALTVRTRLLDLSDDAAVAALSGQFDLVLCGDGLQGARLAPQTAVERAGALLAPGGWLAVLGARPMRVATLVFGQAPTWWNAGDSPLGDAASWIARFGVDGWHSIAQAETGSHCLTIGQRAAVATATAGQAATEADAAQDWLLLQDTTEAGRAFADAVAAALAARGQRVERLTLHDATPVAGSVAADDVGAITAALARAPRTVVHLAGVAGAGARPIDVQPLRCLPLIALAQASRQEALAAVSRPRVAVVTRGACPGPAVTPDTDPAQAPVWGMARVLANEHTEFAPRMIDLHLTLDTAAAGRLVGELLRKDEETEVLLEPAGRWVNRLRAHTPQDFVADARSLPGGFPAGAGDDRAVRLQASASGGLDALHLESVPRRAPAAGEVELAVRAAGLNFRDVLWAMNMLPEEAVEHGFSGPTIGMECAGEVVAVGEGVSHLAVGDRVIGFASGCFASHVTTSAGAVARIPDGLDWSAAATLPTAFLTAWYALDHLARLEPGERVLIHGAAGGVGLAAVQIAKLRGAVVFGTAGNDEKRRLLRLYGADHVLDSRSLAFADDVMTITQGEGVDVVLNSLAGEAITKNLQILRPFGRLLEIGKRDFYANSRIGLHPFRINVSYYGIDADTLLIERSALARRLFGEVADLVAQGKLRPLPHQSLPLARASKAFRLMQQSRHVGKIVVTMPGADAPAPAADPADWQASPDGTYLVTGGLGGFGLATAKWLVSRGARSLALVSRSGATSDEARAGIAEMQAAGAIVKAYAADVGLGDEVARVLADVRATLPPLRGLVHSAMVLDDAPMMLLDRERLMKVLRPKIDGAWHLHEQTLGDRLDCFVVYSSATIVIGNPGQGNYVAGNIYLQALAQWRRAQGLPALSIAWGAIKDVGVVTRTAGLANLLEKRSGIAATPSDQALAELGRMLASGAVAVSVAPFNMQRLMEMLQAAVSPRFLPLAPAEGFDAGGAGRETLAERWTRLPADGRRPAVVDVLKDHLARILGTASTQVDIERPLSDMGLDSLMAVELATSLEREVGRPVSVMQMIQASSAAAVADIVMAGLAQGADV